MGFICSTRRPTLRGAPVCYWSCSRLLLKRTVPLPRFFSLCVVERSTACTLRLLLWFCVLPCCSALAAATLRQLLCLGALSLHACTTRSHGAAHPAALDRRAHAHTPQHALAVVVALHAQHLHANGKGRAPTHLFFWSQRSTWQCASQPNRCAAEELVRAASPGCPRAAPSSCPGAGLVPVAAWRHRPRRRPLPPPPW